MVLVEARDYARQCSELLALEALAPRERQRRLEMLGQSEPELARALEELALCAEREDDAWGDPAMERRTMPSNPTERIGPYRIERVLGVGGMGSVFECTHVADDRRYAVKLLHAYLSGAIQRARREYELLRRMDHPGIVHAHEVGRLRWLRKERAYLVMELVRGRSLADESPVLTRAECVELGLALCAALQHVHERGVLHGDLKPENVIVTGDSRPVILDFGIASDGSEPTTGPTPGTFGFMAPELRRTPTHATPVSDVFSLGALLFEQFTGRPAFEGRRTEPDWNVLSSQPAALRTLLRDALDPEPKKRPPTALAFAARLRRIQSIHPNPQPPTP